MTTKIFLDTALQTGVSIALLIGLVLLIRPLFAKHFGAKATYMLWLLPLFRLVLPPIEWQVEASDIASAPLFPIQYFSTLTERPPTLPTAAASTLPDPNFIDFILGNLPVILIAIWLSVALIWISKIIISHRQYVHALRLNSQPVSETLKREILAAQQMVGIKRMPELRLANINLGPLVTCPWSPILVLPKGFETDYSELSRQAGLVHELAHIKRRDLWAAFAAAIFRAVNWPNPLVHFASRYFRIDLEAACDEYVLHNLNDSGLHPHDYAKAMLGPEFLTGKTS